MHLSLMQYNVQDLFLQLAFPVSRTSLSALSEPQWQMVGLPDVALKPLAKLRGLAAVLRQEAPDVVMLNEVGGEESLRNFAHLFLEDQYQALLIPGRARRGIGNGFLVRRGLPLRAELRSHRDVPSPFRYPHEEGADEAAAAAMLLSLELEPPERRTLSRDLAELRLYDDRRGAGAPPVLSLLLTHLKSAYDPDRIDPGGVVRRTAEVVAVLSVYEALRRELGDRVLLVGDMNGVAARRGTAAEFLPLYAGTDLEDALEVAGQPPYDRITHMTFFLDEISSRQLDYIFLPAALQGRLVPGSARVHRYRHPEDPRPFELPLSLRERAQLPSDHYPVLCALELPE